MSWNKKESTILVSFLHRDIGYLELDITFVYAHSGFFLIV